MALLTASESNVLCFKRPFCVFVFSFDATAQQRMDGFSPKLHQFYFSAVLFINAGTLIKIVPPPKKILKHKTAISLSKNSDSTLFGNEEEVWEN